MCKPICDNPFLHLPAFGQTSIFIKGLSCPCLDPVIQQGVPRPGVTGEQIPIPPDPCHIGNAANVHDRQRPGQMPGYGAVIHGHQGRALPPGMDIRGAEIIDDRDSGQLRQQCAVPNLARHAPFRRMEDGMPVKPNKAGGHACFLNERLHNFCMPPRQLMPQFGISRLQPARCEQTFTEGRIIWQADPAQRLNLPFPIRAQQCSVNPICGCAAHQSQCNDWIHHVRPCPLSLGKRVLGVAIVFNRVPV